jgi:ssDNA-specific exonuclease RecJ
MSVFSKNIGYKFRLIFSDGSEVEGHVIAYWKENVYDDLAMVVTSKGVIVINNGVSKQYIDEDKVIKYDIIYD